jgi:hypothetical protein
MRLKRWIRHPNALKQGFGLLFLGLAAGLFVSNNVLKVLGFGMAGLSLMLMVVSATELDQLFWKSQLEWWDDEDSRFDDWQQGK